MGAVALAVSSRKKSTSRPLAHESAVEISEHDQDGIDLAGIGELSELIEGEHAHNLRSGPAPCHRG